MIPTRFAAILLSCCLLTASCSRKTGDEAHLSAQTMQNILTDIHMAEVYSSMVGQDSLHPITEKNPDSLAHYYREIFAHHKVTPEEFKQSMNWYKLHPEQLDSIYARIIPGMNELEAVYRKPGVPAQP